jgi:glycine/D-amino acid oxidase-like deaminating enzyme
MQLYNEFLDDPRSELSYHFSPRLHVATTADGTRDLRDSFEENLGESVGDGIATGVKRSPVQYLPGETLSESLLLPELAHETISAATYSANLGHLWRAAEAGREFVVRARENGVRFETGRTVTDIVTSGGRVTGIVVDGDEIKTEEVICATGPWNRKLLRSVGIDLPIKHTLGPMLVLRPQSKSPHAMFSLKHEETGYYLRKNPDGTVYLGNHPGDYESVGTEYDPDDVSDTVPDELRRKGLDVAEQLLPYLEGAEIVNEWVGIRSLTPDSEPIIGWTSVQGLSVVSYNASGIQLSPVAGKVIADQVVHDNPTKYYESVSISRFDGYEDHR